MFSIISSSFNQSLFDLEIFIEHHINCIQSSSYTGNLILVFEFSEESKALYLHSKFQEYIKRCILVVIVNSGGIGFSSCLNYAASQSSSTYLMRADTDDFICDDRIDSQISFMVNNQLDLSSMNMITSDGRMQYYPSNICGVYFSFLLGVNPIAHPTVCFNREFFVQYCHYAPELARGEDLDLWIRIFIIPGLRFSHLKQPACIYSLDASYQKDVENAHLQLILRRLYSYRMLVLGFFLLIGIIPNILRLLLKSTLLLKIRRNI